jgi:putative peptide zinc metalloprotease protein
MTATAEPPMPARTISIDVAGPARLDRADGIELLGPLHGSGYKEGVALVQRADGQIVQLGPLMYGLLECVDGSRDASALARAVSERLGRRVDEQQVARLAEKLAGQGLLAGWEHRAPPRRNPLLALRWKVLVTNPASTRRLTFPFTVFFRPWLMWPVLAVFAGVFWFVLIHKGVASATAQAFHNPGLLLLVFGLGVVSAGFHELGHAAACRYGGATPSGMGMGLYLVWPAFYTDVTEAYRLPQRDRLRVDLAGLYFNALVAVATMAVWLFWRVDALLLLVALQILQMVRQLSPVIRADGYHILSDATGVPDLYSHMGPTVRRMLPGRGREPSALSGRARLLVTAWVLVMVPVLIGLMLSAVLLLPRLAASAWDSGRHILGAIPHQAGNMQVIHLLASLLQLLALVLPVAGSALVAQKVIRTTVAKARSWSRGHPARRAAVTILGLGVIGLLAWAWWPSGQYRPVRADQGGTIPSLIHLVSAPGSLAHPTATPASPLTPGTHLAVAMIPAGGANRSHPAIFLVPGAKGKPAATVLSFGDGTTAAPTPATAFPFTLAAPPGPGDTQALAVGTGNGSVTYDVAYALLTVSGGAPVTNTNSAYALADCTGCTTVAVSFQIVLVVGQSDMIAPIDAAAALNYRCPACTTTAVADQIVVTLDSQPSQQLIAELESALARLDALPALGTDGTPGAIASQVAAVQDQIDTILSTSGQVATAPTTATTTGGDQRDSTPPPTAGSTTTTVTTVTTVTTDATTPTTTGTSTTSTDSSATATTSP